ncbi:hypothetical protein AB0J83_12335 [Actinoplanes sp. NPDC049596]|uniref:hypothetical protein n=1 Tax=unclassified Actinoplanes TaxID=2626549 RepID=UPI0034331A65
MSNDNLSTALKNIVGDRPYTPDFDQIEDRGRKLRHRRTAWRAGAAGGFAVAAIAAVAVATSSTGVQTPPRDIAAPGSATSVAAQPPLVQLVGYLTTAEKPAGDATLVLRDTDGIKVYDLWADNGDYYFAKTRAGLPAQVKGGKNRGEEGYRKAVAAARLAAKGDLTAARKQMIGAWAPKGTVLPTDAPGAVTLVPGKLPADKGKKYKSNLADNWVWNNSMDALKAGAGDPAVRAGVLRLLNQMSEVKVTDGTAGGQAVLHLTAGEPAMSGTPQTLTIDAKTGVPISLAEGDQVGVTYTVSRVSLDDVAKGSF